MNNDSIKKKSKPCEGFSDSDYSRYVRRQMSEQETLAFEAHTNTCSICLCGIRQTTVAYLRMKENEENELIQTKTLSLMDQLDQNIFTIVVRAVKGVVELVRSTGEQMLMTPAFAGVRSYSDTDGSDKVQPMRLVKEFVDSKLSVEVTISPVEPDMLNVVVSILSIHTEEFISDVLVACQGDNVQLEEATDANGQASFRVPAAGFYELVMKKENHLLATMTLTGL